MQTTLKECSVFDKSVHAFKTCRRFQPLNYLIARPSIQIRYEQPSSGSMAAFNSTLTLHIAQDVLVFDFRKSVHNHTIQIN